MKKFIALVMAVAVIASMGTVMAFAAEPVWSWNFAEDGCCVAPGNAELEEDYEYVTFTDLSEGDGWLFIGSLGGGFMADDVPSVDCVNGKYIVIKLRLTEGIENNNICQVLNLDETTGVHGTAEAALEKTDEWQYVYIDCSANANWAVPNVRWFRLDPVNCNGTTCDIAWMALFATEADAKDYIEADKNGGSDEEAPTAEPVEETEAPVEETEAPVEETEAPVEETKAPVEETEVPEEETAEPTAEPAEDEGCGSAIGGSAFAVAAMAAVVIFKKRRS